MLNFVESWKMAATIKALLSLECTVFRSLKFTFPRPRYTQHSATTSIYSRKLFSGSRFISTGPYLSNDQVDSGLASGGTNLERTGRNENEKRTDLERFKELLFEKKSQAIKLGDSRARPKKRKPKSQAGVPVSRVRVSEMKDMLSSLKRRDADSPEDRGKSQNLIRDKLAEATRPSTPQVVKTTRIPSVEADKFRDVLSALGQDSSTSEEVIMAGRQISSDSKSTIEGAYNIKQQQFRDKDKRKRMAKSSFKTGPRFHMFDTVRGKWAQDDDAAAEKSIFQEMAEDEVKELGMSSTVQSGFHDLMDDVHRQWTFPVDNEICKTEEEDVGFDEHVFLEHYLAEFPKAGNIEQFMELVVTGLQQNPHLSVQDKREHIEWFREYFQNMPDEQVQL